MWTPVEIDETFMTLLARHSTIDESLQWSALSQSVSNIDDFISRSPETVEFTDPVIRLYLGLLGRLPDVAHPDTIPNNSDSGFFTNVASLRSGHSLEDLTNAFLESHEYNHSPLEVRSTETMISEAYLRLLDRNASFAEVRAWTESGHTDAQIFMGIAQSSESLAHSTGLVNYIKSAMLGTPVSYSEAFLLPPDFDFDSYAGPAIPHHGPEI